LADVLSADITCQSMYVVSIFVRCDLDYRGRLGGVAGVWGRGCGGEGGGVTIAHECVHRMYKFLDFHETNLFSCSRSRAGAILRKISRRIHV
jgi:hypothetical protein